jgi:hypothetical protein
MKVRLYAGAIHSARVSFHFGSIWAEALWFELAGLVMGLKDFQQSVGRQRAVWVAPGGKLLAGGQSVDIGAILTESGTAILEPWFFEDELLARWDVQIPIFRVPPGAFVLKAVATCGLAAIGWEESDNAIWAIDQVRTEVEIGSQEFFVVPSVGNLGKGSTTVGRISYYVTVYLGGLDVFHQEEVLRDLERV